MRMQRKFGFAGLAWLAIVTAMCSCRQSAATKNSALPNPAVEVSLSGGVRFIEVVDGVKRWDISSDKAEYSTSKRILNLSPVRADYYEDGVLKYKVSAKEGIYDSELQVFNLRGDIFAESDNGYTLKTETLKYQLKERVANSDDYFKVQGKGLDLVGTGLNADLERGVFNVLNGVKLKAVPSQLPR